MLPFASFTSVLDALSGFAWPAVVATALWVLWPEVRRVIRARSFTIKVAGFELTAQEANEQLALQLDDLQKRIVELEADGGLSLMDKRASSTSASSVQDSVAPSLVARERTLLWVDDNPSGNAYEIETLRRRGWRVLTARSTSAALKCYDERGRPSIIVTDLGREEDGGYNRDAGLVLIDEVHARDRSIPIVVYTSSRAVATRGTEVARKGALTVTDSPSEVLRVVETAAARGLEIAVERVLRSSVFEIDDSPDTGGWDFVGRFEGRQVAIEVVGASVEIGRRVRERVTRFREANELSELWIVTENALPSRELIEEGVRQFTFRELTDYLRRRHV